RFPRVIGHVADGGAGRLQLALDKAELGQAGLRRLLPSACLSIGILSFGKFAADTVNFRHTIESCAHSGTHHRLGKAITGELRFLESILPVAVQLQNLGAPHLAMPSIRNYVRL